MRLPLSDPHPLHVGIGNTHNIACHQNNLMINTPHSHHLRQMAQLRDSQ